MPISDLAEKILEQVRLRGPLKAKDIASGLKIDRAVVNQALYGPLKGKIRQAIVATRTSSTFQTTSFTVAGSGLRPTIGA